MDAETLLEFAKLGVYCQFDLFGTECSFYQLNPTVDMPSDAERINKIVQLVGEGYEDRILISHDVHTKHRLVRIKTETFRANSYTLTVYRSDLAATVTVTSSITCCHVSTPKD